MTLTEQDLNVLQNVLKLSDIKGSDAIVVGELMKKLSDMQIELKDERAAE